MGTIAEKLNYLNTTKTNIKNAIIEKGVEVSDSDTFRDYATKIADISSGSGPSEITLLQNTRELSATNVGNTITKVTIEEVTE